MNLRELRAGVSLRELHRRSGIALATLSRIENGERDATEAEEGLIKVALGPGADRSTAQEQKTSLDCYPAAPPALPRKANMEMGAEHRARRDWFARRNAEIQRVVKPPPSGTFGGKVKEKK